MSPLSFTQPFWLLGGVAFCAVLAWLFVRVDRRQRRALAEFATPRLAAELTASVSPGRRTAKRVLILAGVFLLFAALARPVAGFRWEETQQRTVDVLFAVDTSKSMLTPDVKPDRLTRAKLAVEDLAARLDGDRLGLIAFAGESFLQCPLTLDADAFRQSLEALDTQTIPKGGTDIASAIEAARDALHAEPGQDRILILLSDGEDLDGGALDAARAAAKDGLKIYTVGVGTPGGELIPVASESGGTDFVRDEAGKPVRSRLDEGMMRRLAEATGGSYQPLGARGEGLEAIYQAGLAPLAHDQNATRMERIPLERFEWPLGIGLLLLLAEPLFGTRRREPALPAEAPSASKAPPLIHARKGPLPPRPAGQGLGQGLGLAVLLAALGTATASASTGAAEKAFQGGDYARAAKEYSQAAARDPQNKTPELQFDYGAAAYKDGQYGPAAGAFQKSLQTDKAPLQQGALYNFGNTLYRLGQQTEKADSKKTMQAWQQAVAAYEAALKLDPKDADAQFNHDFVQKKLQELQKQNQQNQQNKPDQNSKQDSKQDQNQSQSQGQNQNQSQGQQGKPQPQQGQQNPQNQNGQGQQNPQNPSSPPDQPKPGDQGQDKNQPQPKPGDKGDKGNPADKKDQGGQSPQDASGKQQDGNAAGASAAPGQMTKEEAKSLLDAERGEERKLPLSEKEGKNASLQRNPEKDW